jgi:hypothetical protein
MRATTRTWLRGPPPSSAAKDRNQKVAVIIEATGLLAVALWATEDCHNRKGATHIVFPAAAVGFRSGQDLQQVG